jgi:hypothetical protein
MAGLDDPTVVLRGGPRDGQLTTVDPQLIRLVAPSDAPGLVDVYERTGELAEVPDQDGPVEVFEHVSQEPAGAMAPELHHAPGAIPGDS